MSNQRPWIVELAYANLNVDTDPGAEDLLYARIRQAAQDVCSTLESRELLVRAKWLRCFDSAMSATLAPSTRLPLPSYIKPRCAPEAKS